ncbi:MAG: hypothetical protein ACXVH0_03915 [Thermoanaerobaculia bacterium]
MANKKSTGLRRKSFSPWVRYPSLVLLYGLLVPAVKVMEKTVAVISRGKVVKKPD